MARVNILKQMKTANGWRNVALRRDARNRIKWTSSGTFHHRKRDVLCTSARQVGMKPEAIKIVLA